MSNKKQTHTLRKNRFRIFFITYNVLVIITLLVLSVAVLSQQKVIDAIGKNEFNVLVSGITGASYSAVNIDAGDRKGYVPQAGVAFEYTSLLSDMQYRLVMDDSNAGGDTSRIFFSEKRQLVYTNNGDTAPCRDPYVLSIKTEIPEDYTQVATRVLSDGRPVVYAASSMQECAGYIQGETGQELLATLLSAQSY